MLESAHCGAGRSFKKRLTKTTEWMKTRCSRQETFRKGKYKTETGRWEAHLDSWAAKMLSGSDCLSNSLSLLHNCIIILLFKSEFSHQASFQALTSVTFILLHVYF